MKTFDLVGMRFGRLSVIQKDVRKGNNGQSYYICKCDCGKVVSVVANNPRSGHTKSCGCIVGQPFPSSLGEKDPLYKTWVNAKTRCYNPKSVKYARYGGRGISMCDEWKHNFPAFYQWANTHGYKPGLQIDRIDNDGNYSPDNCRFVTNKENTLNKSVNVRLTFRGVTKTQSEWGRELSKSIGVNAATICKRLTVLGWDVDRALSEPTHGTPRNK